jgi:hypothetical protein
MKFAAIRSSHRNYLKLGVYTGGSVVLAGVLAAEGIQLISVAVRWVGFKERPT